MKGSNDLRYRLLKKGAEILIPIILDYMLDNTKNKSKKR